jgi:hypothetical protein
MSRTAETAEAEADARLEQRQAVRRLIRITRHHVGDASPNGVDQGATVKRAGLATVAVASGPLEPDRFRQALQAARQHRHLVRFEWDGTERYTLPEPQLLRRVQREAGERGDGDTVGRAHRILAEVEP